MPRSPSKKIFSRSACFPVEPDTDNYGLLLENIRVNNFETFSSKGGTLDLCQEIDHQA